MKQKATTGFLEDMTFDTMCLWVLEQKGGNFEILESSAVRRSLGKHYCVLFWYEKEVKSKGLNNFLMAR